MLHQLSCVRAPFARSANSRAHSATPATASARGQRPFLTMLALLATLAASPIAPPAVAQLERPGPISGAPAATQPAPATGDVSSIVTGEGGTAGPGLPDLVIISLDGTGVTVDPQTLRVSGEATVVLMNLGETPTTRPFLLTVFEDRNFNSRFDPSLDNVLSAIEVGSVSLGTAQTIPCPVSGTILFRNSPLFALADSSLEVEEIEEQDNLASASNACPGLGSNLLSGGDRILALPGAPRVLVAPARGTAPHVTYNGREVVLKAVAYPGLSPLTSYRWDFSDGTTTGWLAIGNSYAIEVRHTFPAQPEGSPLIGTIRIRDLAGRESLARYITLVVADTLEARRQIAVDNALWYLHKNQARATQGGNPVGYWWASNSLNSNPSAATAIAVAAFQSAGHNVTSDASRNPYAETVQRGISWLMHRLTKHVFQESDRWFDVNQNGYGLRSPDESVGDGTSRHVYQSGLVLLAIANTLTPDSTVAPGIGIPEVTGRTYAQIAQEMADYFGGAQFDTGASRGGWRYSYNQAPDMSAVQWPVLGMQAAEAYFGIQVHADVKQRLRDGWVVYDQNNSNGGFGYSGPNDQVNVRLTAAGLSCMWWVGIAGDAASAVRARTYIGNNSDWNPANRGDMYEMFGVMKAARLALPPIEYFVRSALNVDWYDVYSRRLVSWQANDGRFDDNGVFPSDWLGPQMRTAMGVLIIVGIAPEHPHLNDVASSFLRLSCDTEPRYVTARIGNGGARTIDAGLPVSFYDGDPSMRGALLGTTFTIFPMRPGLFEDVTLELPGNFDCTRRVWVVADAGGTTGIEECDETNNVHSAQIESALDQLTDATLDIAMDYWNTTYNRREQTLVVRARARNTGTASCVDAPLMLVIDAMSDSATFAVNPDGYTPDGKPYFMFTSPDQQPTRLAPGESTPEKVLIFRSTSAQVNFQHSFRSRANRAPVFVSFPATSAVAGRQYRYAARAIDADNQPLTYRLIGGPIAGGGGTQGSGMSIDPQTGVVSWLPAESDIGSHTITIEARDDCGGVATQRYPLDVSPVPVNRPPMFTTTPITRVAVGASYEYAATAVDPDGDALTYSLLPPTPAQFLIDAQTGRVSWDFALPGYFLISIRATDGRGGEATQTFELTAGDVARNPHAPRLFGTPGVLAAVDRLYFYQPAADDPDPGQTLTFSLLSAPTGMTIHAATGRVQWTPTAAQGPANPNDPPRVHRVHLRVEDGAGGAATQAWDIQVLRALPNRPPVIDSIPNFICLVDTSYEYDVSATDPEGQNITFSLVSPPPGMTIDAQSGLIRWTPSVQDVTVVVAVKATDSQGAFGSQVYELYVSPPNHDPVIESLPVVHTYVGQNYRYDVNATDPDGHALWYQLLPPTPSGMTIDTTTGLIRWTPTAAQLGPHAVMVQVADRYGGVATQAYTVEVLVDTMAPTVNITASPDPASINAPCRICVPAGDNVGVVSRTLTIDGESQALDSAGCVTITPSAIGSLQLSATATDAEGNVGSVSRSLVVGDPNDPNPPQIVLHAPASDAEITVPVDVIATINDNTPEILTWRVELESVDDGGVRTLGQGSGPIDHAPIGRLDPTLLKNGTYTLKIFVNDGARTAFLGTYVAVAGDYKPGRFTTAFTDLTVPVAGVPMTISRRYDSIDPAVGDFGVGWRMDLPGEVSDDADESVHWSTLRVGSRISVTRPDGKRVNFRAIPQIISPLFFFVVRVQFLPEPGTNDTLGIAGDPDPIAFTDFANFYDGLGFPFNPRTYELTTRQGIRYEIDERDGLRRITDLNGNVITVTPQGLASSQGLAIQFVRDGQGRIVRIIEPDDPNDNVPPAEVSYAYDARGNLVLVRDQDDHETTLVYDDPRFPNYLTEVRDPLGRRGVRNEYDDDGRLIANIDANGHRIEYTRTIGARQEVIRDREGHPTVLEYDVRGNVVTRTDALGGTTTYEYNADSRLIRETDCAGRVKSYTYNASGDLLTETNCSSGVTVYTRNNRGQRLTKRDALGNLWTYQYDARGNLLQEVDPLGGITTHTYDAAGNRRSTTNPLGHTETMQYDGAGRMTVHIDFAGARTEYTYSAAGDRLTETRFRTQPGAPPGGPLEAITTTYRYDGNHREIEMIDGLGGSTRREYDDAGQLRFIIDPLNRVTENVYDVLGNLVEVRFPDGTFEAYTYDLDGRRKSLRNRDGHVTRYDYDQLGRLTKTIHADATPANPGDNPFTEVAYDCVGRIINQYDERRNQTHYDYACTPTNTQTVTDALGRATIHEFDLIGQRVRMIDANLRVTRYVYDGLGRQIRTVFHDGTFSQTLYDAAGRKERDIDQDGKVTRYEHDPMGRLTAVFLHLAGRELPTRYTYDELGNQLTQTDAELRTTRFEYDRLSRRTRRILPLGQTEIMTYNIAGELRTKRDFNGATITYDYDLAGRLRRETTPDGGYYEYAYNGIGKRTLERIVTPGQPPRDTVKQYDERGRLARVDNPDASSIEYAYDAANNRTRLVTTTPQVTQVTMFEFDALNRLERVHHPDAGGTSTYTYDLVGNRASLTLPNATVATYQYDALNRLTVLTNRRSDNSIISRYAYTLSPSGQRLRVDETTPNGNARVVVYTYDGVYRLTGEQITDPEDENLNITYTYDDVGNRLTKRYVAPAGTVLTTYEYDDNDRLLSHVDAQQLAGARQRMVETLAASGAAPDEPMLYLSRGFAVAALLPLAGFLLLLAPPRAGVGRRAHRRRVRTLTICWLVLPILLLTPETLQRAHAAGVSYEAYGAALERAGMTDTVWTYTYDDNGNTLTRSRDSVTDTYTWDFRNRLLAAENLTQDGSNTTFTYDVDGIRVAKTVAGESAITFLCDKNRDYAQVLTESIDPAGPEPLQSATYVYGDDLLTMTRPESGRSFYHFDGQMSTRQLSSYQQTVLATFAYSAFGEIVHRSGSIENPYLYGGQQHDVNMGFAYLRARYYNSHIGRFVSFDKFDGKQSDPRSLHKYLYAHGNPTHYTDWNGEFAQLVMMLILRLLCFVLVGLLLHFMIWTLQTIASELSPRGFPDYIVAIFICVLLVTVIAFLGALVVACFGLLSPLIAVVESVYEAAGLAVLPCLSELLLRLGYGF